MKILARVDNSFRNHLVTLTSNDRVRELPVAPGPDGVGSSANGGELLCLALATCYCNDLYREAKKRGIEVHRVEVEVEGTFGAEGAAATRLAYHARVSAKTSRREIIDLMQYTDSVAEIQNTLRRSCPVLLTESEAHEAVQPRHPAVGLRPRLMPAFNCVGGDRARLRRLESRRA